MEARIGGESHHFFPGSSKGLGKKPQEWVSSEWKWDGDLFVATPVDPGPLECGKKKMFPDLSLSNSTSSNSDEVEFRNCTEGLSLADKRRRIVVFDEDEHGDLAGNLTLKLGGHANGVIEEDQDTGEKKNCKRGMVQASNSNRSKCQVEGCGVDLCQSKDYHRRHKVCEMHAKASSAMVGNVIQRFCQQCSRFHLLQEFDEGKRSCRRRLAGHNKRRRKNNADATPNGSAAADDQTMGYLLISLLRILANLNSDRSEQSKDQELLTNLLRNIASLSGPSNDNKSSGVQEASQGLHAVDTSAGTSKNIFATASLISGALPMAENFNALCPPSKTLSAAPMASNHMASVNVAPSEIRCQQMCSGTSFSETLQLSGRLMTEANGLPIKSFMLPTACTSNGVRTNGFDLNTVCDDEQEVVLGCQQPENPETLQVTSNCPPWMLKDIQQRSPPQTSGNTDSTSTRSPSSSNGDAQSRTDRIVFKLFGKDPSDFPLVLRTQIFDWLSHSPTDIESYIRPGCIVLTLYFRLGVSTWDELCYDLGSSLKRLLLLAADDFWRVGWIYATVQHNFAVIYNGQVVLNKSLMMDRYCCCRILCVTPIAVPPSSRITFKVKVSNLPQCTRLYCAFEGEYLIEDTDQESVGYLDNVSRHEQFQFLNFSCVIPDAIGRGFIEVEENSLSSGFFPFIVAEEDVCAELRMLESSIDVASSDELLEEEVESERSPCMTFLHEMGWLLRRCQLRSRSEVQSSCLEPFSLVRFRWILRFAINHDWSAIVKKALRHFV
ncbi:hypothetical protein HPP92_012368 [Vanilla planifolia]|uniref:SBP-type domain-containing protein n=1 Tax=Vanilla planifolia TaxID=51239 RepID=A0A835QRZ7_VANPL|nr:hypothetical protein HPP92_012368 [Vanilla planifolia]